MEHLQLHSVHAPATPALLRTLPLHYPNLCTLDLGAWVATGGCGGSAGPGLDPAALGAITLACRRLQTLRLPGCRLLDDACVEQVLQNCPALTGLDVLGCPLISQASLLQIGRRYRAQLRQYVASFADAAALLAVTRVCPSLRVLGGLPSLTLEEWLRLVQDCPRLTELVKPPAFPQDSEEWLIQTVLGVAPELEHLGCVNVDYYRGLQYLP